MEVHLSPETEIRLNELAVVTGRAKDELVEDAMTGYFAELAEVQQMLERRYDEAESGKATMIDGEESFAILRRNLTSGVAFAGERVCSSFGSACRSC